MRMCCAMPAGSTAKEPEFNMPEDGDYLDIGDGLRQPADWLGEGFAVRMDTRAKNTPFADWRVVFLSVRGSRDVFFMQIMYKMGVKNLSAKDNKERFLALQAEFVRCALYANIPLEERSLQAKTTRVKSSDETNGKFSSAY